MILIFYGFVFSPVNAWYFLLIIAIVIFTPIFFFLKIPYVMPMAMGLLGLPTSIVSVSFGIIIYYMLNYFSASTNVAKVGTDVEETANQFQTVLKGILGDRGMLVLIAAFAVCIILVYVIRRSSMDHSWRIAIGAGAISLIVCILIGDLVCETNISFFGVVVGTVVSAALMLVVEFFAFNVDYSRTEKVQFEDDDYYYYVKAVPKVTLSAPDRKVKRINRAKERHR